MYTYLRCVTIVWISMNINMTFLEFQSLYTIEAGGQKSHPGITLKMVNNPDETVIRNVNE